jgi:hypothetical protein
VMSENNWCGDECRGNNGRMVSDSEGRLMSMLSKYWASVHASMVKGRTLKEGRVKGD